MGANPVYPVIRRPLSRRVSTISRSGWAMSCAESAQRSASLFWMCNANCASGPATSLPSRIAIRLPSTRRDSLPGTSVPMLAIWAWIRTRRFPISVPKAASPSRTGCPTRHPPSAGPRKTRRGSRRATRWRSRACRSRRPPTACLSRIEPGAIGSTLVLLALIGGIGYGGWAVLQEVQRVQVSPVEQTPRVLSELDPLDSATAPSASEAARLEEEDESAQPACSHLRATAASTVSTGRRR